MVQIKSSTATIVDGIQTFDNSAVGVHKHFVWYAQCPQHHYDLPVQVEYQRHGDREDLEVAAL